MRLIQAFRAIFALAALSFLLFSYNRGDLHPADKTLLANFTRNEQVFEKLVEMIRTDKRLLRIDQIWTIPTNPQSVGITEARILEYRTLLIRLGLSLALYEFHRPVTIILVAASKDWVRSPPRQGYAYLEMKPNHVVGTLKNYWPKAGKPVTVYQHIKGNWYIFFDFKD
ncbi:MAG: hypothetical protein CVV41_10540 [Candidatus Riflebacteria bacterium HGW-Riflebacteria-1]|jgi:hypothetical protein|nr:MAG: hypothetical protein CVV41_10540 [Candidatus Riflebacteria bacterium HGW-Riflebacteria-1]